MSVKVRFAPSPTGYLHVGNARTALITWLFARKSGGHFLLRIDDTDLERSKDKYETAIEDSLTWLGLNWDEKANQKDRMKRYGEQIEKLKSDGRLYPCYETPEELSLKRKSLLSRGKPPIYDRAALDLTDDQKTKYEEQGLRPHWRFKLEHKPIEWNDLIRGEVSFHGKDLADPVLIREDGSPLYHICSVIDDIDFDITHVIRGEDHVSNTATHVQMFEALGDKMPDFAHLSLISDGEGGKLSKRLGALSVKDLREEDGLEPMAITSLLARMGTSDPIEAFKDIKPLIENFDFSKFSRSTPKFDPAELLRLNAKILHNSSLEDILPSLEKLYLLENPSSLENMPPPPEASSLQENSPSPESAGLCKTTRAREIRELVDTQFWEIVRPNLERLRDIEDWWHVANGPIGPVIEDPDFIAEAAELLPNAPWNENTWSEWTSAVKDKTGRKGKQLFMPLRQALTGMNHGPEMASMLLLIGPDKVKERLGFKKAA